MLAGINYCRLLWKLYGMKRNAGRTKEQIERLQKKKLEKLLLYAYDHSSYYRRAFEAVILRAKPEREADKTVEMKKNIA